MLASMLTLSPLLTLFDADIIYSMLLPAFADSHATIFHAATSRYGAGGAAYAPWRGATRYRLRLPLLQSFITRYAAAIRRIIAPCLRRYIRRR